MHRATVPANFREREAVTGLKPGDQLIQQRALGNSRGFLQQDLGGPGTAKRIDLTVFGLIGRRNAGVANDRQGVLGIYRATLFCRPLLVTTKVSRAAVC